MLNIRTMQITIGIWDYVSWTTYTITPQPFPASSKPNQYTHNCLTNSKDINNACRYSQFYS